MGVLDAFRRNWEAVVLALAMSALGGWWAAAGGWWAGQTWGVRSGVIVVTTEPADATVLIDGTAVKDSSPVMIEEPARRYTVSVTRTGYLRNDQIVQVRAGRATPLKVKLAPSADTGFDLTCEPTGGLVWFDGEPIMAASGGQARTDLRHLRVQPGHHVIEIRNDGFKHWQQDIEVYPGIIRKVHAVLIPGR